MLDNNYFCTNASTVATNTYNFSALFAPRSSIIIDVSWWLRGYFEDDVRETGKYPNSSTNRADFS